MCFSTKMPSASGGGFAALTPMRGSTPTGGSAPGHRYRLDHSGIICWCRHWIQKV